MIRIIMTLALAVFVTSCANLKSLGTSHQTDKNAVAPTDNDRDVLLAAIANNQQTLASKLDSNVEKGLVIKNKHRTVERDTKGEAIQLEGGAVLYGESDIELRLSTFHELADKVDDLKLDVATKTQAQAGTNQVYGTPAFDGLRLHITGSGGAGLKAENVRAPAEGRALEKAAAGKALVEAIKAQWEGRKNTLVVLSDGTRGILKEIYSVTPAGIGKAAVEMALDEDGVLTHRVEETASSE